MKNNRIFAMIIFGLTVLTMAFPVLQDQGMTPHKTVQRSLQIPANDNVPTLPPQRQNHILYGDNTGGGHLYGVGKPCKSEFPKNWSAGDIITTVQTLAANDNAKWSQADNGYYASEQSVDGVAIRLILNRNRDQIITAYPVNTPRNACPNR